MLRQEKLCEVMPGSPPVIVIHDPQMFWIEANIWESDINRVRLGSPVEVWVDAFKTSTLGRGKPFRGRVVHINPTTSSEVSGLPPERFFTRREQKIVVKVSLERYAILAYAPVCLPRS